MLSVLLGKLAQGSHVPWKSLNLKIKIQGLESPWKVHWVFEKPFNLLFDRFHLVEELEKTET